MDSLIDATIRYMEIRKVRDAWNEANPDKSPWDYEEESHEREYWDAGNEMRAEFRAAVKSALRMDDED